ncbi:MAG: ribosome biogenesis factor YjgA [Burkholderiales bacterium]
MNDGDLISKTQRKRRMLALQDVGKALARLPEHELARLDIPPVLREALAECRRLTTHEAIRRQLQYIGRLMRKIDAEPIAARLEAMHAPSRRATALFHLAERWRDDMLADPGAVARFAAEHPGADERRLADLAAAALEERRAERAPKRYRELFQAVSAILRDGERGP